MAAEGSLDTLDEGAPPAEAASASSRSCSQPRGPGELEQLRGLMEVEQLGLLPRLHLTWTLYRHGSQSPWRGLSARLTALLQSHDEDPDWVARMWARLDVRHDKLLGFAEDDIEDDEEFLKS